MLKKTKLTSDNGNDIIIIDFTKSMFLESVLVKPNGNTFRPIDTELITHVTLEKSKMSSLIPVMNYIAKDWGLNLSKSHDLMVANRILVNSVKKN